MKIKKKFGILALYGLLFFAACGKKGDPGPGGDGGNGGGGGNGGYTTGSGIIYYDWATEGLQKVTLQSGVRATVLPENTARHGWNISKDGKTMVVSSDAPGTDYDANLYTITNITDGTIISQFKYYPTEGDYTIPYFSPDGTMLAVDPTYDDGIIIMNLQGRILHNLASYGGKKISGHVVWMADNTLLFPVGNSIYRTNQAFTTATLVKTLNFSSWGHLTASKDGSKIALKGGNHIYMMNADGSNLVQVTQSDLVEAVPEFSPDGKYLAIGTDYHETIATSYVWKIVIIPADGKLYNVNEGADNRVIPLIAKGQKSVEFGDGNMEWR